MQIFFVCGYNQTKRVHKLACERASADCSFGEIVSNDFQAKPKDRSRAWPKKSMPKGGSPEGQTDFRQKASFFAPDSCTRVQRGAKTAIEQKTE